MALNNIPQTHLGVISRSFKDLSFNFTRNPITNDINILKSEESIKTSVKNLILTKYYERLFNPDIGTNITSYLFESNTFIDTASISEEIKSLLTTFEPRIILQNVQYFINEEYHTFDIQISYYIIGEPILQVTNIILTREM